MSTDLDTDEYTIEYDESSIHMPLNELELDYNIPINFTIANDLTANQFDKTMQANVGNNTPPISTKSCKPSRNRASTPYKAVSISKLWRVTN